MQPQLESAPINERRLSAEQQRIEEILKLLLSGKSHQQQAIILAQREEIAENRGAAQTIQRLKQIGTIE
jgi:hypothetical protein